MARVKPTVRAIPQYKYSCVSLCTVIGAIAALPACGSTGTLGLADSGTVNSESLDSGTLGCGDACVDSDGSPQADANASCDPTSDACAGALDTGSGCAQDSECGSALMWACVEGECTRRCLTDNQCPSETICISNLCRPAECQTNSECAVQSGITECQGAGRGHGRCVQVVECSPTGNDCPANFRCEVDRCLELPRCTGDRTCGASEYCQDEHCQPSESCTLQSCANGLQCVGGVCVPSGCRGDADCAGTELCIAGACQTPPTPQFVTEVRIISPAGVVSPGTTATYTAIALNQAGRVIPGVAFSWTVTSTLVATIDSAGTATGGQLAGSAMVVAAVNTGSAVISSPGVGIVNLGPTPAQGVRVTVVSLSSGTPISGAEVEFGGGVVTTNVTGTAILSGTMPGLVTVMHAGYDFVSLQVNSASSNDLVIPVPPLTRGTLVGGMKGTVDLSGVSSQGSLLLSLSGASISSPLVSFDPGALFGGDFFTVTVPSPTGGSANIPIPAANTVAISLAGTPFALKDTYYARATTGIRAAWSFGGRVDPAILTGGGGGGGGAGGVDIIGRILPYFQRFDHGLDPEVNVVSLPTIVDSGDVDRDMNRTELVPDYGNFPTVPLVPNTPQDMRYHIAVANLPVVTGGNANTLLVLAGSLLPGIGFVPLGLDGLQDMAGSGIILPFNSKLAAPHDGLEVGEYAILATALRATAGALPGPGSARLFVRDRLPEDVDLSDGWIDSPQGVTWSSTSRTIELPAAASVDLYRVTFLSDDGAWHVYVPAPSGGAAQLTLPSPGTPFFDRTDTLVITVDAIDLEAGVDPSDVFGVEVGGVLELDRRTRGFARSPVP